MNRKTSGTMRRRNEKEVALTPESIDSYLEHLRSAGRVQGTLDSYRRKIGRLYQTLPEGDKAIRRDTLPWWREKLAEEGCSAAGINQFVIVVNGYLGYMDARELQVTDRLESAKEPQLELTRHEYLRLLSAARSLDWEQAYLLVKVFGNSDLPVQELSRLTVEAARAGMISISRRCSKEIIRFPDSVCRELLDYAERQGVSTGPIFLTRAGKLIDRTYAAQSIRRLCPTAQVPEEKEVPGVYAKCTRPPGRALSAMWPCWWNGPRTGCWKRSS